MWTWRQYVLLKHLETEKSTISNFQETPQEIGARGSLVVKALCYKPEGRGFETPWVSIYLILPAALGPGVHSASNRNEYQKQENNVSEE
jgi:hypothetical protein